MKRALLFAAATSFVVAVTLDVQSRVPAYAQAAPASAQPSQSAAAPQADAVATHKATLQKYCCELPQREGEIGRPRAQHARFSARCRNPEPWEHAIRKVRTGAMPPAGRPRPDKAVAGDLVTYLETELDRAALAQPNPGRPALPRLNRAEYHNAIRDLLALDIDAASMLPNDIAGYGFDNNADALTLSPMLTERYLGAAAKIGQMALARPRGVPMPETFFVPTDRNRNMRISDDCPWDRAAAWRCDITSLRMAILFEMRPKESGAGGGFEGIRVSRTSSTSRSITSRSEPARWAGPISLLDVEPALGRLVTTRARTGRRKFSS